MDGSLNSIKTIEGSCSSSQTFLSLDIDDFCQSYSKLILVERDPALDSSSTLDMMSRGNILPTSPTNSLEVHQPQLLETLNQEEQVNSENQQLSRQQSFAKFLSYLTKQDQEQNSILSGESRMDSNRLSSPTMNNQQSSVEQSTRFFSLPSSVYNHPLSFSNNITGNNSLNSSLSNAFGLLQSDANTLVVNSSPLSPPTMNYPLTFSNNTIITTNSLSPSNIDPKDSKTKLALSSPKRKNSIVSTTNSVSSSSNSSNNTPTLLNTKLTKQSKTRKRKNSCASPSQLSMQFNFPIWTFHFSKGQSSNRQ